jgi:hypothetical protein
MTTMATNARNVRIRNRSRIAAQNLMEGDECLRRGAPSVRVTRITRSESDFYGEGSVTVRFDDGSKRTFVWDERVSIVETPDRHRYRRNSLRRNGYKNYLVVRAMVESPTPTPKRKPKKKRPTR